MRTGKVFSEENSVGNGITYILFDQDGHPIKADCALEMSASQIKNNDCEDNWLVSHSDNPIPETVTSNTFVPASNPERLQESSNAYYLRTRDAASPKQCFTIELS